MKLSHRIASGAAVLAVTLAGSAPAAPALPPPGDGGDPPLHCPPGYHMKDDVCVKNPTPPPPPPENSPVVHIDVSRQTTDLSAVHVRGYATDADSPTAALTVRLSIDGVVQRAVIANKPLPPVATQGIAPPPPVYGDLHGFDEFLAAAKTAQTVCVTAVNVGATGSDTTECQTIDQVQEFVGYNLDYDLTRVQILHSELRTLDTVTNINSTNVQQTTTVSGSQKDTESHGWETHFILKAWAEFKVKIPLIHETTFHLEGSCEWIQNGSQSSEQDFSWEQPVIVPTKSKVVARIAVTDTTISVPYTLSGQYIYRSGATVSGAIDGTFSGTSGHDLQVSLTQYNLDGTPAARAVAQPQPTSLLPAASSGHNGPCPDTL
jgi:hypothetical protein